MILVNNPGTWGAIYPPLKHSEWNGCTPTDLIFPFFLFIVGVAIPFSLGKRIERGEGNKKIILQIIRSKDYFLNHDIPRVRAAQGMVFLKEVDLQEFYKQSTELKKLTENK